MEEYLKVLRFSATMALLGTVQECRAKIEEVEMQLKTRQDFRSLKAKLYELIQLSNNIWSETTAKDPALAKLL